MSLQMSPKGALKLNNMLTTNKSPITTTTTTTSSRMGANLRRALSSPFVSTIAGSGSSKPRAKDKILSSYKVNKDKHTEQESVSTLELFRYASGAELLATGMGIVFMWYAATWQPISVYNLATMATLMGNYVRRSSWINELASNYTMVMQSQGPTFNLDNSTGSEAQYSDERAALSMLEPIYVLLRPIFDSFMSAHSKVAISASNSSSPQLDPNTTVHQMIETESTRFLRQSFELNGAAFSLATTQATAFFVGLNLITWSARRQAARIKILYLRSCLMQEAAWFEGRDSASGSASSLSALVDKFEDGIGPKLALLVYFLGHVGIFALSAFLQHFKLAASCLPYVLIVGIAIGILSEWQAIAIGRENHLSKRCHQVAEEIVNAVRTIFAFSGEQKELDRYKSSLRPVFKSSLTKHLYTAFNISLSKFSVFACFAAYCYHAMKLFPPYDQQGPGSKATVLGVMRGAEVSIVNILISIPFMEALQQARGSIARLFAVIERQSAVDPSNPGGDRPAPGQWEPSLSLKNVQFTYKPNSSADKKQSPILQQLSLDIKANQSLALVGPSGSGKSTILALIQRFYEPTEGQILLDGRDITTLNVSWWRNQIALVSQEPRLFDMTIEENIRLGLAADQVASLSREAVQQEVRMAARAANADDFIKRLPNKYKTRVGPAGVQLSGGQKQRIAIARALIRKPKILLLDEPTSALDSESESKVQEALRAASRGRTTITVAHRLATVRHMDKIVVLEQGQVVESGNHRSLMAMRNNGLYRQMYKQQEQEQELEQELEEAEEEADTLKPADAADMADATNKHHFKGSLECLDEADEVELSSKAGSRLELSGAKGYKLPKFCVIWKFLQLPTWTTLIAVVICLLAGLIMPINLIAHSYLFKTFANQGLEQIGNDLRVFGIFILSLSAFVFIISFLQVLLPGYVGETISKRLRAKIMNSLLQKPMSYYDMEENSAGALCGRFNSHVSNVQNITGARIAIILEAITTLSVGIGYGFSQNLSLSLFCFTFALMVLSTTILESHLVDRENLVLNGLDNKLSHLIGEVLSNMRIINSLNKEQFFVGKFTEIINRRELGLGFRVSFMRSLLTSLKFIMPAMGWSASMFYGSVLLTSGRIDVQTVFIVCPVVLFAVNDTFRALVFLPELVKAYQSVKSLFFMHEEYLTKDLQTLNVESLQDAPPEEECIEFKDVCFSYPCRPTVLALNKLSFAVKSGESVALVGSSGSGKSTCATILEKFYNYQSGEVRFQGRELRFASAPIVRAQIGLVSQEPTLLTYTIAENIAYGDNRRNVPFDEIVAAARKANIHDFIMQLPQRYDTLIGSQTSSEIKLSGGQKQRIAIARALVRNAPVMIFDEATSALDAPNELLVAEALKIARHQKTSITIAHRLATIKDVDRILVLHEGCLIESGSHEELLQRPEGRYKRLWESQQKRRMIKSETVN